MANIVFTRQLGRFIELADLPRRRDGFGTDDLILHLAQASGLPSDATLRNCVDLPAMVSAGLQLANFTNYGPKTLGPSDRTITPTLTTPFKMTLAIPGAQVWNPAGGAVNNTMGASILFYRRDPGHASDLWIPLGKFDASGSASGGSYTHTPGTLVDQTT